MTLSCENIAFFNMDFQKKISVKVAFMVEFNGHPICYASRNANLLSHLLFLHSRPIAITTEMFDFLTLASTCPTGWFHYKHTLCKSLCPRAIATSAFLGLSTWFSLTSIAGRTSNFSIILKHLDLIRGTFVAPFTLSSNEIARLRVLGSKSPLWFFACLGSNPPPKNYLNISSNPPAFCLPWLKPPNWLKISS